MNLGKLLAAGKSIFGGRGEISYRENKRVYVPKFGDTKSPFAPVTPAATSPAPSVRPPAAPASRLTTLTTRLNPFRAAPPVEAPVRQVFQPELSLSALKVIHNDLADADIEVVPVRSRSVRVTEPVTLPASRANGLEFFSGREVTVA